MNCTKCGGFLPQGAQFCNICNEPVSQLGYVPYASASAPQQGYTPNTSGYTPNTTGYPPNSTSYTPNTAGYTPVYAPGYDPMQAQGGQPLQGGSQGQGTPSSQGFSGQSAPPSGFQQSYAQYGTQQSTYPQGYQPIYGGYHPTPAQRDPGQFLAAISQLPRMFLDSFRDPGAVLRGMMERRDRYAPPVVCGLALLMAFFCGMAATRALVTVFINAATLILPFGNELARADGINRIAGNISAAVGGIAVLCQLIAMVFPLAVMLVYLCAVCKVRFSFELLFGLITLLTMPTLPISVFTLVASLFSPLLPPLFVIAGMVISYVFMGSLTARVTGKTDDDLVLVKIVMILLSLTLTLVFVALAAGLLSEGITATIMSFISRGQ